MVKGGFMPEELSWPVLSLKLFASFFLDSHLRCIQMAEYSFPQMAEYSSPQLVLNALNLIYSLTSLTFTCSACLLPTFD